MLQDVYIIFDDMHPTVPSNIKPHPWSKWPTSLSVIAWFESPEIQVTYELCKPYRYARMREKRRPGIGSMLAAYGRSHPNCWTLWLVKRDMDQDILLPRMLETRHVYGDSWPKIMHLGKRQIIISTKIYELWLYIRVLEFNYHMELRDKEIWYISVTQLIWLWNSGMSRIVMSSPFSQNYRL